MGVLVAWSLCTWIMGTLLAALIFMPWGHEETADVHLFLELLGIWFEEPMYWVHSCILVPVMVGTQVLFLLPILPVRMSVGKSRSLRASLLLGGLGAAMLTTGLALGMVSLVQLLGGWVDDLGPNGLQVRCITGFNSGPPMTPGAYNNNVQVFQTTDSVVLLNEMNHNVRVVSLDGRPHHDLRQWTGDSRGYWDDDTLVVETRNFARETSFMRGGASADLRLSERFTRVAPDVLLYQVTVDDPMTWTRPWTYEVPMQLSPEPVFEYACHEGNYAMEVILTGARTREAETAGR